MNDGIYLELFHGRRDPDQEMDDWGKAGPVLGPFPFVHTTYASDIKLGDANGTPCELNILDGLVYYDGMWYGDWSAFSMSTFRREQALQQRHQRFDPQKASMPEHFRRRPAHEQ